MTDQPIGELWRCGECEHVNPSSEWGIADGDNDTAVCPCCKFTHYDDDCSVVDHAGWIYATSIPAEDAEVTQ